MAYYNPNDVVPNILSSEIAIDLTQDDPSAVSPDADIITDACNDASDEIDSYVGKRYVVPASPVPPILTRTCATIIGYMLFNRRVSSGQVNKFEDAYNNAIKWLTKISLGQIVIDGLVPLTDNPKQTGGVVSGTERTFTPRSMRGL